MGFLDRHIGCSVLISTFVLCVILLILQELIISPSKRQAHENGRTI